MAENSKIEWTDHTFNPWWGCQRVSAACDHCYAETMAKRFGQKVWGPKAPRRFFGEQHWQAPLRWHQEAARTGVRKRVFCASMADVFEKRVDLNPWREKLWAMIKATPALDWLLLTKRPQLIAARLPPDWGTGYRNVWLGTTTETQAEADRRLPALLNNQARVHFVSAEPLLSELNLAPWLSEGGNRVGWVIAGGESGPGARQTDPKWFRSLRDQCATASVPFHFKQWGNWAPDPMGTTVRVTKAVAGRMLDGRTWDGLPIVASAPAE
jgi:protein gp37